MVLCMVFWRPAGAAVDVHKQQRPNASAVLQRSNNTAAAAAVDRQRSTQVPFTHPDLRVCGPAVATNLCRACYSSWCAPQKKLAIELR